MSTATVAAGTHAWKVVHEQITPFYIDLDKGTVVRLKAVTRIGATVKNGKPVTDRLERAGDLKVHEQCAKCLGRRTKTWELAPDADGALQVVETTPTDSPCPK